MHCTTDEHSWWVGKVRYWKNRRHKFLNMTQDKFFWIVRTVKDIPLLTPTLLTEWQTYSSISESRSMKRSLGKALMLLFAKDLHTTALDQYNQQMLPSKSVILLLATEKYSHMLCGNVWITDIKTCDGNSIFQSYTVSPLMFNTITLNPNKTLFSTTYNDPVALY